MVRIFGHPDDRWNGVHGRVRAERSFNEVRWPRECIVAPCDDTWPAGAPPDFVVPVVNLRLVERLCRDPERTFR